MNYFVTAIGTDSGKTVVSAILVQALQADYLKPVQAGMENRDVDSVCELINNNHSICFDERFLLKNPMSPHAAAKLDGVEMHLSDFEIPNRGENNLVIEGAGGVLVPLNDTDMVIDLAVKFDAEVVLVSNIYLGSINHTLLTVNELKRRSLNIKGIIFNGPENRETEELILKKTGLKCLLKLRPERKITQEVVTQYAVKLFENWV